MIARHSPYQWALVISRGLSATDAMGPPKRTTVAQTMAPSLWLQHGTVG
jgi:hypothetical protein